MADLLEQKERGCRFVYGRPEMVESEIARVADDYVCTNLFFYVVKDQLEVCATLIAMREIRKQQFAMAAMQGNLSRRPN
jgi:hypothetical protein